MFKIEKDVPVGTGVRLHWPFQYMKPGESFGLPADPEVIRKCRLAAGSYAFRYPGMRFSVRKQADGTARCWRVE